MRHVSATDQEADQISRLGLASDLRIGDLVEKDTHEEETIGASLAPPSWISSGAVAKRAPRKVVRRCPSANVLKCELKRLVTHHPVRIANASIRYAGRLA